VKKYLGLFKNHLASAVEYRSNLIGTLIVEIIALGNIIILWVAIFRTNTQVGSYTFPEAILYYLLVPLTGFFTQVYVSDTLSWQIRNGSISSQLIKPYKIWLSVFTDVIAQKLVYLTIALPIYLAAIYFIYPQGLDLFEFGNVLIFLAIVTCSFVLHFFMDLSITWLAFWLDDVWAFRHIKQIFFKIMGGVGFPFDLLPSFWQLIFNRLPFKFFYYVPISYLLKRRSIDFLPYDLLQILLWMVLFIIIGSFLWKKGLKKYGAYGN